MKSFVDWLGLVAVAALMTLAVAPRQAEAMTASRAGLANAAKQAGAGRIVAARVVMGHGFHTYGGGGGGYGGGGHFYGGGGHHYGGGGHFYGGGYRWRPHYYGRSFYYGPSYYYGSGYYPYPRRCRVVWTYYGPRRICRWHRPWYW